MSSDSVILIFLILIMNLLSLFLRESNHGLPSNQNPDDPV